MPGPGASLGAGLGAGLSDSHGGKLTPVVRFEGSSRMACPVAAGGGLVVTEVSFLFLFVAAAGRGRGGKTDCDGLCAVCYVLCAVCCVLWVVGCGCGL